MDNMTIYNQGREVPSEATKTIDAGRLKGFTDINPMWRIKRLTELFGPCGFGWWYTITDKRIIEDLHTNQTAAFVDIDLYVKDKSSGEVSYPIPGTGGSSFVTKEKSGHYMSDECFKMALTDALSVAAKALGIGADVYFSADRSKYTNLPDSAPSSPLPDIPPQTTSAPPPKADTKFRCSDCGRELVPYTDSEGRNVSLRAHAGRSIKVFGTTLCLDCIKHRQAFLK